MLVPTSALTLPTDRETLPTTRVEAGFCYRVAYARAAETQATGDPGQDYVAVQAADRSCVFVLCDGVSQSFFGDLAAAYLGEALLAWLTDSLPGTLDSAPIITALTDRLQTLTGLASEWVRIRPIPEDLPPMLRTVLAEKRTRGSESTFVCARIDRPGPDWPVGRLVLAWMGDSRLRIWGADGERTVDLGPTFLTQERWSSLLGPLGHPHVFVAPLVTPDRCLVTHLLVYSDGLSLLDQYSAPPLDPALQDLIQHAGTLPGSDDISLLDIAFDPPLSPAAAVYRSPTPARRSTPSWLLLVLLTGAGLILLGLLAGLWAITATGGGVIRMPTATPEGTRRTLAGLARCDSPTSGINDPSHYLYIGEPTSGRATPCTGEPRSLPAETSPMAYGSTFARTATMITVVWVTTKSLSCRPPGAGVCG